MNDIRLVTKKMVTKRLDTKLWQEVQHQVKRDELYRNNETAFLEFALGHELRRSRARTRKPYTN